MQEGPTRRCARSTWTGSPGWPARPPGEGGPGGGQQRPPVGDLDPGAVPAAPSAFSAASMASQPDQPTAHAPARSSRRRVRVALRRPRQPAASASRSGPSRGRRACWCRSSGGGRASPSRRRTARLRDAVAEHPPGRRAAPRPPPRRTAARAAAGRGSRPSATSCAGQSYARRCRPARRRRARCARPHAGDPVVAGHRHRAAAEVQVHAAAAGPPASGRPSRGGPPGWPAAAGRLPRRPC